MAGNVRITDNSGAIAISPIKMEKTLKIWQAVMSLVVLIITVGTLIVNQSNKLETQRLRIEYLESADKDKALIIKDLNQQMNTSYKEINAKLTDIQIMLQNKENKK
jgi:hypothetical protein